MILKAQRGRGKKIHILLDDEYVITTDVDYWAEIFIPDGTDIDDEEWQALFEKINYRKAFNKCADLLSRRDHSIKELRDKLLRIFQKIILSRNFFIKELIKRLFQMCLKNLNLITHRQSSIL